MTMRMSFCVQAATTLDESDLDALTEAIETLTQDGIGEREAERLAVGDQLAAVAAERRELVRLIREQHGDKLRPAPKAVDPGDDAADAEPAYSRATPRYERLVKGFANGDKTFSKEAVDLGRTPAVLRMLGAADLALTIRPETILKAMRSDDGRGATAHELSPDVMLALPELLNEPVLVLRSKTQADSFVVVTELRDGQGKPVVAAVHLSVREGRAEVNRVASSYGRDRSQLQRALDDGDTLYADMKKAPGWATTDRLQLPWVVQPSAGAGLQFKTEADLAQFLAAERGAGDAAQSRGNDRAGSRPVAVRAAVDRLTAAWAGAPDVVVLASMDDAPEVVRAHDAKMRSQGAQGEPEGFFYGGKVYLNASALADADAVRRVLFHEALGHFGLRGTFGNRLEKVLRQVMAGRAAEVEAKRKEYGLPDTDAGRLVAAEEVLAVLAQTRPELGVVQRAVAAVRAFLRSLGLDLAMTDADLVREFIEPARAFVERGGKAGGDALPAFSRGAPNVQQALDENGRPVWRGGGVEIAAGEPTVRLDRIPMDGQEVMGFAILPADGSEALGRVELLMEGDRPLALLDIETFGRGQGVGRTALELLLAANPNESLEISNIVPEARGFWEKMGVPLQNVEGAYDGALNWSTYAEAQANDARGAQGAPGARERGGESPRGSDDAAAARRAPRPLPEDFDWADPNALSGDDALFSRSAEPSVRRQALNDFMGGLRDRSSTSRFNFLHKTLATQLHKAHVDADYARVFNIAQDYELDIARSASRPAAAAPDLLPSFDNVRSAWNRLVHGGHNEQRVREVGAAVWAGTLHGGPEPHTGKVWSDAELRERFKLDDEQVQHYRQARAAIDASLDESAAALAFQMLKAHAPELREAFRRDPAGVRALLEQETLRLTNMGKPALDALNAAMAVLDRAKELKDGGYAPLTRFGRYAVSVTDDAGTLLHFEKFETELQAKTAALRLRREYPGATVERSTLDTEGFKLFAGVDPESVALFAKQLEGQLDDDVLQAWYRNAVSERSAFKRMIGPRKGMPGFSEELRRVLASFITSNARMAARQFNMGDMAAEIQGMRERRVAGDVVDEAVKLKEYLDNPVEPFAALKGLMFTWYLGGSVASAAVNATQPVMMTLPYLSQFGSASKHLAGAVREAMTEKVSDPDVAAALARAAEDGKVDPQEVHHLYHEGMSGLIDKLPAGQRLKDRAQGAMTLWGAMFGAVENFNRRLTFIAAYRMAKADAKLGDPYAFAIKAVDDTQGIYGRCVDVETEMLTAEGWKRVGELREGEAVFSVNERGELAEDLIERLHIYPGKHAVTELRNSRGLSVVVTDQHDNLVQCYNSRDKKWQAIRKVKTIDLKKSHFLLRAPLGDATGRQAVFSDDEVRLLAWVAAEGHFFAHRGVTEKRGVGLVQSLDHNPAYVAEIDALLERLGGHFNRKTSSKRTRPDTMVCWQLRKPLWSFIHRALPGKRVTMELVAKLTVPQMAIFVETFAKGDGSKNGAAWSIRQKAEETLHTLQAMAVMSGSATTIWPRERNLKTGGFNDVGALYVAAESLRAHVRPMEKTRRVVDTVWCPQTHQGTWIARRNGRTFLTGNSNRPNWARGTGAFGAVGAAAFTFKQYSIAYVELLVRMARSGPQGKRAALAMLGILVLAAGSQGLPGMDDLDDLVDTVLQKMGYRGNFTATKRETLHDMLGSTLGDLVMYGAGGALPLDLYSRIGMGNLLPATGLLMETNRDNKGRELAELIGPVGGLATQVGDFADAKPGVSAMGAFAPLAIRNGLIGLEMLQTGEYKNTRGYKVADVSASDAVMKMVGFQPQSVSERRRPEALVIQDKKRLIQAKADILSLRAQALIDRNPELRKQAAEEMREWNEANPEMRIAISDAQVLKRVKEMRTTSADRLLKSTPKEARRAMAEAMQ